MRRPLVPRAPKNGECCPKQGWYFRDYFALNRDRLSDIQGHPYTQTWVKCLPLSPEGSLTMLGK